MGFTLESKVFKNWSYQKTIVIEVTLKDLGTYWRTVLNFSEGQIKNMLVQLIFEQKSSFYI